MYSKEVETITKYSYIHTYTTHLIYLHAFGTLLGHKLFTKEDNNDIATYIPSFTTSIVG